MIKLRKGCISKIVDNEEKANTLEARGFVREANTRFDAEKSDSNKVIVNAEKHAENGDLSGLTVKELRFIASKKGINLKSRRKADIVKEIMNNDRS